MISIHTRFYYKVLLLFILVIFLFPTFAHTSDETIETSGDILQILIPAVAYGATFYLNDTEGRAQFYKSFFTNVGITYLLKYSIDKKRPNGKDHSFPSNHVSFAFQGATFIYRRYGWKYSIPAYIGAAFVGYSRVKTDNHYIEDVLAGAAIGIISSLCFTTSFKEIEIAPAVGKNYYGLTANFNLVDLLSLQNLTVIPPIIAWSTSNLFSPNFNPPSIVMYFPIL